MSPADLVGRFLRGECSPALEPVEDEYGPFYRVDFCPHFHLEDKETYLEELAERRERLGW